VKSVLALALLAASTLWAQAYEPVLEYDPARDAARDIELAVAEAKRTGRFVLLEIGGDWCVWCHYLDDFLAEQDEIREAWEDAFVAVKLNVSQENRNEEVMARYPKVAGYPHFFILDADGKLAGSQNTGELQRGRSYHKKKFQAFLDDWNQKRTSR
jgi:thioredoxin-related protein